MPRASFLTACAFIDGYRWGSDDESLAGFNEWMIARGSVRPELAWYGLVLCEIYPGDALPDPRNFGEAEDRAALDRLFDLLDEFYRSTA